MVDLGDIGDPSVWCGLWTLDIEDHSVCSIGRQMSLMKKPLMMCHSTVSCLTISMASLMRLGCHASMGVMSWAACHSIWWSLMCECLTMADFSKSPLRPCARCSFILVGRLRFFPDVHLIALTGDPVDNRALSIPTGSAISLRQPSHLRSQDAFRKHTVVNLSQRTLTPIETSVLSLWMIFALTPKCIPTEEIIQSVEPALRRLNKTAADDVRLQMSDFSSPSGVTMNFLGFHQITLVRNDSYYWDGVSVDT